MKLLLRFSILFSLLSQSCADSDFLDRARKDQSILQGANVSPDSSFAKSLVLITQDLIIEKNQPFFFGICTGLIISRRVVMTAAHCLDNGHKNMKIVFNPNPRENLKTEDIFRVLKTKIHPSYEMRNLFSQEALRPKNFEDTFRYNDIALLAVDRDFPEDQVTHYSSLLEVTDTKPQQGFVAGYGKTTSLQDTESFDYKEINGSLKQAHVRLQESSFQNGRIFLNQKNKGGVCKGDSGAPLFIQENGVLKPYAMAIGVFSKISSFQSDLSSAVLENGCAGFGIYLILQPLQEWITTTELNLSNSL